MKKILVVDDEKAIVTLLEYNLKKAGYSVDTVSEGVSAYNMAVTGKYDFILLDLMLPGMDGPLVPLMLCGGNSFVSGWYGSFF